MQGILHLVFKFEVQEKTRLGRACIAKKPIAKNEIICKMVGPSLSLKDFFDKYELNDCTPLQIGNDRFIDLIEPYNCFNHSCNPNAGIRNNGILFALKDISPGEEIMYDYSTTVDDVTWRMDCDCREANCRKVIGDFLSIPHEKRLYYRENGAFAKHIIETYF